MKKDIIIFDLDGTLALINHRKHLVEKNVAYERWLNLQTTERLEQLSEYSKKVLPSRITEMFLNETGWKPEWDKFYELCDHDLPNDTVIQLYKMFTIDISHDWSVYIFSGRSEVVRQKTTQWLRKYGIFGMDTSSLFMRPKDDFTPDDELKKKWLEQIGGAQRVFCVFDDRDKVVEMWRSMGITCFQVAPGNF